MRILITGGNGFLGSNLLELFLRSDHEVAVVSRNSNNISEYLHRINYIKHSSQSYFEHEKDVLAFEADVILHMAWEGGNSYNDINDLKQIYKNVPSGLSLLEIISKQKNAPKFIGCGSFLEYGTINSKVTEDTTENPNSFYGLSKLLFKKSSEMYCKQREIPWNWIRPCYIYGRGDVHTRLMPSVINRILDKEDVVLDDCNAIIDYLHVEDFCSAVSSIVSASHEGTFNICSGEERSLRDVIAIVQSQIDPNRRIIFDSSLNRSHKPKYVCGSNERLKILTGWSPKVNLQEGVKKTIEFYKYQRSSK